MNVVLSNSLYLHDKKKFDTIRDMSKEFNATCNGNNIVQDDIFNVIKNYGYRNGQNIEIIRIPIYDEDFCACTCVRKGRIFIVSNSYLPISKQVFAAAHELYHIIKYVGGEDEDYPLHGSILRTDVLDVADVESEDREANAFADLFLASSNALKEQIDIYNISIFHLQKKDLIRLMDIFAIPYKAVVLRLFEEHLIDIKKADELLNIDTSIIEKEISLTGIALRWQKIDTSIVELGSLNEYLSLNENLGFVTESRLEMDQKRIHELLASIQERGKR